MSTSAPMPVAGNAVNPADVLVQSAPEGMAVFELDGTLEFLNPTAERMYGAPLSAVKGTRATDLLRNERVHLRDAFFRVAQRGRPEVVVLNEGGRWFSIRFERVQDRVVVVARETTEEVRNRRRLELLNRISAIVTNEAYDLATATTKIVDALAEALNAECSLCLLSADGETLTRVAGATNDAVLRAQWNRKSTFKVEPVMAEVMRTRAVVRRAGLDPREVGDGVLRDTIRAAQVGSFMLIPVVAGDEALGLVSVGRGQGGPPLDEEAQLLACQIVSQFGLFVSNIRRRDEATTLRERVKSLSDAFPALAAFTERDERQQVLQLELARISADERVTQRLEMLLKLVGELSAVSERQEVERVLVDEGSAMIGAHSSALFLLGPDRKQLQLKRERGYGARKETYASVVERCVRERNAVFVAEATESFTGLPVIIEGQCIGAFGFAFNPSGPDPEQRTCLELLVRHGAEALRRVKLYEELKDALQLHQAIFQASPAAVVLLDEDGIVRDCNPDAERIFGWTTSEIIGRRLPYPPEQEAQLLANVKAVVNGGVIRNAEVRRTRKGGEQFDLELHSAPLKRADGRTWCLSVCVDITARKRAERGRKLVAQASALLSRSASPLNVLSELVRLPLEELCDLCIIDLLGDDGYLERTSLTRDGFSLPSRVKHEPERDGVSGAIDRREPVVIRDLTPQAMRAVARDEVHLQAIFQTRIRSMVCVPLLIVDRAVGALTFAWQGREVNSSDVTSATEMAAILASALAKVR